MRPTNERVPGKRVLPPREYERCPTCGRVRSLTVSVPAHILDIMGTCIDREIAQAWGVSQSIVQRSRVKLRISPFRIHTKTKYDWASVQTRLGRESDKVIANDLNCSREMVRRHRVVAGIAAFNNDRLLRCHAKRSGVDMIVHRVRQGNPE